MSKFSFIRNSANNRVFCDALIRYIAVEIVLSGVVETNMLLSSYSKYDYEIRTGRCGGYNFKTIEENLSKSDLTELKKIVKEGYEKEVSNFQELRNYLTDKLEIDDDYLHCLNDMNEMKHTFAIKIKREQNKKTSKLS